MVKLDPSDLSLEDLCTKAWEVGQTIDLGGIVYGYNHWVSKNGVSTKPEPYYHFLAGLASVIEARQCLEIGTHCGGGAGSLLRGMNGEPDNHVVTVDLTNASDAFVPADEHITKFLGDANHPKTIAKVTSAFSSRNTVDIVFIDGSHQYLNAYLNYVIYCNFLKPTIMVFDDIALNDQMKALWSDIQSNYSPNDTIDVTRLHPEIRKPTAGFGVVLNRSQTPLTDLQVTYNSPHVWRIKTKVKNTLRKIGVRLA